jgi:type II secretory ATPase GspE/PulE/Tfp pilus assembly ATPase PilB-like protein
MGREQVDYLVRFMKNIADLDTKEKRKPQKGKFRIERGKERFEWEIATAGSTAGEQIVIRRKTGGQILSLNDIGLTSDQLEKVARTREMGHGLFIVSGPRKSGVTTTMYSLLKNHDAFINSIFTLEREVMAEVPNITQERFSFSDTGTMSFAEKLDAVFRMGPDVVGVAECLDKETAEAICKAANERKIVYLVLEADSVIKTMDKWIRLVGDKNKALQGLAGISNQRILRKLCSECKQAYAPNTELLRKFNLPADKAKVLYRAGKVKYDKHGKPHTCEACQGTGFVGRTAVFEVITLDDSLRKSLMQAGSVSEIGVRLRAAKMLYLQELVLRNIIAGNTSINEMMRVLAKPKEQKIEEAKKEQV